MPEYGIIKSYSGSVLSWVRGASAAYVVMRVREPAWWAKTAKRIKGDEDI